MRRAHTQSRAGTEEPSGEIERVVNRDRKAEEQGKWEPGKHPGVEAESLGPMGRLVGFTAGLVQWMSRKEVAMPSVRRLQVETSEGAGAGGEMRLPEEWLVRVSKSKLKARRWERGREHGFCTLDLNSVTLTFPLSPGSPALFDTHPKQLCHHAHLSLLCVTV